ncbi:MAG: S8 family serine peptidase [Armatimonadetes bacterium]|nr:S8 family serine peptidase [Armatimonadota bacterium]
MKRIATSIAAMLILCCALLPAFSAPIFFRAETIHPPEKTQFKLEAGASHAGYYVIQFAGPVKDAWKQEVEQLGIKLGDYLPDYGFVAKMNRAQIGRVMALESVRWVQRVKPEHRKDASLKAEGAGSVEVAIKIFRDESPSAVESFVKGAGGSMLASAGASDRYLLAALPANSLDALASLESVEWIEPWVQPRPVNNVAQGIIGVHDVRERIGLYGAGQVIAFADSGLDTGSQSTMSADFANRILAAFALRRQDDWSDPTGHGTHSIGVATGSGALSGSNPGQHSYDTSFAGVAPEAGIVVQSIGDTSGFVYPPLVLSTLFQPTYDLGARVHNDSWGSPVSGKYTFYSQQVDEFINAHRDFIAVFPMGNDGRDGNSDGVTDLGQAYAPATAKNCIAVGATENVRSDGWNTRYGDAWPGDFPVAPLRNDYISDNAQGMASWSSRGPCVDGRIKPDICAPGTNILSARTHAVPGVTGWMLYNPDYIFWGGTSMSTPMVAGTAALVRQHYIENRGVTPSAALIKATLLNGATDLTPGQHASPMEVPPRPNSVQGWGRVNLSATLDPPAPKVLEFVDEGTGLLTGQSRIFEYSVLGSSVPFSVTLVWTDPPSGSLSGKQLVNDLHLRVEKPGGQIVLGNGTVDTTNNVESVDIASPAVGTYRITVIGNNVPQGPQTFALVVSGELPGSYIAGKVTTASGFPVPGVTMTMADGGVVYNTMTSQNGDYTIHLPSHSYIVIPSKDGWTFAPENRLVSVGETGLADVDFVGSAAPGCINGTIARAVGGRTNYSLDSDHPYADNSNMVYTIAAHPSATRIRVHFDETWLQNGYDYIYVEDADGTVFDTLTGEVSDYWSAWVTTGNVAKIRLLSDESTAYYGFHIDGYETDVITQGPAAGVTVTAQPGGATAISQPDGTYTFASVEPVNYTLTPSLPHWSFSPMRKAVSVQPGGSGSVQNFLGFPPGTITGTVSAGTTAEHPEIIESEHPYPDSELIQYQVNGPPGTSRIRIHFAEIDMEAGFDFIDILDGGGNIVESFTGTYSGVWSVWVTGDFLTIRLQSDDGFNAYGFRTDKYEAVSGEHGVAGVTVTTEPQGFSAITDSNGIFTISNVDAGQYFVSAQKTYWSIVPGARLANVAADVVTTGIDFYGTVLSMPGIAYIKTLPDGSDVRVSGKVVTAGTNEMGGYFYIEEAERFAGIRVDTSEAVPPESVVTVAGQLTTSGGERRIEASKVEITSSNGQMPGPLGLRGSYLGGGQLSPYTPGVAQGIGLNNVGLLITTWGRVTYSAGNYFYLEDGSGLQSEPGRTGVKVLCGGVPPPVEDAYVQVTGISSCEEIESSYVRVIRVRNTADIKPLNAVP